MGSISPIQYQSGVPVNPDTPLCFSPDGEGAVRIVQMVGA